MAAMKISLRMPAMANASFVRGWAGCFAVSADLHPLIGPLPAYEQIYAAFGCNGTGFKVAPAVGKALAEYALGGSTTGIALDALRPARYCEDAAIVDPCSYADRPQEQTHPPRRREMFES
jgi:glycine/D-amino acid oxidase-like deaminating enzyme